MIPLFRVPKVKNKKIVHVLINCCNSKLRKIVHQEYWREDPMLRNIDLELMFRPLDYMLRGLTIFSSGLLAVTIVKIFL